MQVYDILQICAFIGALLVLTKPLGRYIYNVLGIKRAKIYAF